jgi:hypothetical protein
VSRRLGVLVLVLVTLLAAPWSRAHAACNLIPSATQTFRSSLGSTNKPGALASACSGPCLGNCRCGTCNDAIPEQPLLKVLVKTRNEIGRLVAKAELPLSTFDAATPVRVRLADADSSPIADTQLASIPASGTSATKFLYKVTNDGLQKVLIKQKPTGVWQIVIRSKHWFTAAAADGTAAETELDLTIGTQCFKHAATLKVD